MRISDWSSDVCSSDLLKLNLGGRYSWDKVNACGGGFWTDYVDRETCDEQAALGLTDGVGIVRNKGEEPSWTIGLDYKLNDDVLLYIVSRRGYRSEEHTSELQSLMRISYAVFCLKKKQN